MSEKNLYRNSLTGMVEHLTDEQAAVFPKTLERVPEGTKPYLPGMFTPGYVGEHDSPPPLTDDIEAAQAELDAVLEDNAPQSKVAREAKARVEAAEKAAAKAAEKIKE
ncbi:MAG TPA: hypothetical protein VFM66_11770 [Agromyces sp.]|nr:hypothetical protein [Agromyces sp.]